MKSIIERETIHVWRSKQHRKHFHEHLYRKHFTALVPEDVWVICNQYKKLPVTMKMWMQFNVMPRMIIQKFKIFIVSMLVWWNIARRSTRKTSRTRKNTVKNMLFIMFNIGHANSK